MAFASQKDFVSGLMFMAVGGSFAWGAVDYEIGNAARMGPGYFPFMLGLILVLLGVLVTFNAFKSGPPGGDKIGALAWRPLVFILGANLLFGALLVGIPAFGLPAFGLIVAIFGLVIMPYQHRHLGRPVLWLGAQQHRESATRRQRRVLLTGRRLPGVQPAPGEASPWDPPYRASPPPGGLPCPRLVCCRCLPR